MKCTVDINNGKSVVTNSFNVESGIQCSGKAKDVLDRDNGLTEVRAVMYRTIDDSGVTLPEGSGVLTYSEGIVKGISLTGSTSSSGPMVQPRR